MSVRVYYSFDELPDRYQEIFAATGKNDFFLSNEWFQNLASTALEPGVELRLYGVEDDAKEGLPLALLIACSPAGRDGSKFEGWRLGPRTVSGLTNYQSIEFGPLLSEEVTNPAAPMSELIRFLASERPGWSLFDFNLLNPGAAWFQPMIETFRSSGYVVRTYLYAEKRYEPRSGRSFKDYLAKRSNNERKGIWRHQRQLEEKFKTCIKIVTDKNSLDQAIKDYEYVLAASWKQPEKFPSYTAGMIRASAEAGVLRLGLYYLDEKPVAAQIWIVAGGRATIYKLHYDQQYKRHSVGSILTAHLMEHVMDVDKVDEVDFGLFEDKHKQAWMTKIREVHGLAAFNPRTVHGLAALVRFDIEITFRKLIKAVIPILKSYYARLKPQKLQLNNLPSR